MSEEKIIEILKKLISWKGMKVEIRDYEIEAIQGLLDLYNEEKNKNASLQKEIKLMQNCDLAKVIKKQEKEIEALKIIHNTYKEMIEENGYISKDKIREIIKKYGYGDFSIQKIIESLEE